MRLGDISHERMFAVEMSSDETLRLQEQGVIGNFTPTMPPAQLPLVASVPEATDWSNQHAR
ncbi:MAG: hypothetical protein ACREQ2_15530 [Candidatus Binatia bacterium]